MIVGLVCIACATNGRHQPLTLAATIVEEEMELAATFVEEKLELVASLLPIKEHREREQNVREKSVCKRVERKRELQVQQLRAGS